VVAGRIFALWYGMVSGRLIACWRRVAGWVIWFRNELQALFGTKRFAKILKEFLIEVAVLVFVFPTLEGILRGDSTRLPKLMIWSLAITGVCLSVAAIISMLIGETP